MAIRLGGLPLLASQDISWMLTEGVRPNIQTFEMIPAHADALAKETGPIALEFGDIKVEKLYVIDVIAGDNPFMSRVRVSDRRLWWSYKLVNRLFNKRRNIGFKRVKDTSAAPEILPVVPKVWYRRWTLKDTTDGADPKTAKWDAKEMLREVLEALQEPEFKSKKHKFPFRIESDIASKLSKLPIQNLQIRENGDAALRRALRYLPEAAVYVDYDGTVVVYSRVSGKEVAMIQKAGAKIVGQGDVRLVSNANIRPKEIRIFFQYQPELRFDSDGDTNITLHSNDDEADRRTMENVLASPDFTATLADGTEVAQGTWITFDEAFAAWGPPTPYFTDNISHDLVRKALVPYMDLWAGVQLAGAFQPDADWAARISAVKRYYLRTWRIRRQWVDRILKLMPFRSSLVNVATGTRAPAIAYSDYSYLAGQRSLFNEKRAGTPSKDWSYAMNVKGHPARSGTLPGASTPIAEPASKDIDQNSKSSPATVKIEDSDQGIVQLEYMIDPYRLFEAVLPSMITLSGTDKIDTIGRPIIAGPTGNITNKKRPITFDAIGKTHANKLPTLKDNHKVSVILSVMVGSPNNEAALYRVTVKPSEIKSLLPSKAGIGDANGPPMDIYIGAGLEVARIRWSDEHQDLIQSIFINEDGKDRSDELRQKKLVLNDAQTSESGASLREIAKSAAARIYASLADRVEGEVAGTMTPGLTPAGWLASVELFLSTKGEAFSRLSLPDRIEPLDIFTFMDSATRAVILRLASPEDTL